MTNPKIGLQVLGLVTQNKSDRSIDALAFLELGLFWNIRNSIFQRF